MLGFIVIHNNNPFFTNGHPLEPGGNQKIQCNECEANEKKYKCLPSVPFRISSKEEKHPHNHCNNPNASEKIT